MADISDIIGYVESYTGHGLNRDEGIQFGDSSQSITGATVAWMASPDAIQAAGEAGHDLLIAHESIFYPYDVINMQDAPQDWIKWKVNQQRLELFNAYNLSCLRLHGSVDEICIFDSFANSLGFGNPVFVDGLVKVYEIEPCSLASLIDRVKQKVGMPALRVAHTGDCSQSVHRVGLPWGGLGLFVNVTYQQKLVELDCDVFIAGESDNYGFRFAVESGIPMIETSHDLSENPGLKIFTELLSASFPDVSFQFYENAPVWRIV